MTAARLSAITLALLLSAASSLAQGGRLRGGGDARAGSIRGKVVLPGGGSVSEPIKISLSDARGPHGFIYTDSQGVFEMRGIAPGEYTLEAEAERRPSFEVVTERVVVQRDGATAVMLYLKERRAEGARKAAVVSATELGQKVPEGAAREFERASKAGREGRTAEAVAHLRQALAIFPGYLMARNDLGTYLLAEGKLEEAAAELRAAVALDPKAFNPRLNLGIVLLRQNKFGEAAESLERALALNAGDPSAQLFAGLAHASLGVPERAERELRAAYELGGKPYALALFHLGRLRMEQGRRDAAVEALEAYLRETPDAANAGEARRMIAMLR